MLVKPLPIVNRRRCLTIISGEDSPYLLVVGGPAPGEINRAYAMCLEGFLSPLATAQLGAARLHSLTAVNVRRSCQLNKSITFRRLNQLNKQSNRSRFGPAFRVNSFKLSNWKLEWTAMFV